MRLVAAIVVIFAGVLGFAGSTGAVDSQTIVTIVGTGVDGFSGDGGAPTAAAIDHPRGITLTPDGGLVFAEPFTHHVRKLLGGRITTLAGTGVPGYNGDNPPGVELSLPHSVSALSDGTILIADAGNHAIRRYIPATGSVPLVAGTRDLGYGGDGGPATRASLDLPRGVAALPGGGF